jgi:glycosyltransferase involved in cell wall biosynthesis
LQENAGCDYDHYVLDQASEDGTGQWLRDEYDPDYVACSPTNVGISRGMNTLLDWATESAEYDVVVKFDNDCELTQPNTLRDVCHLALVGGALLSPRICGLQNPPTATREARIGDETILDVPQIGGIFLAAPAWVYDDFRYTETNPAWGMDDVEVCGWFRAQGGTCGYVKRLEAWHYETTGGQHARFPGYFARTILEGKSSL